MLMHNPQQAHQAIAQYIWPEVKAQVMAGRRVTVEVREEKRSDKENRLLHALLGHIAKTQEWAGKKRDIETWKRLLTAAWCRAIGDQVELLPALDGHGVDIVFRRTSQLTRKECADLIEFIQSWAAENDVTFPPPPQLETPKPMVVDAETGEILEGA
jgi:hypothetical protein